MDTFRIDDVNQVRWLLLVAAAGLLIVYGFVRTSRAMELFASSMLLGVLAPHVSRPRRYVKAGLLLAAMSAIVVGLMGPRWGMYWEDVQQRQLDLVICLDVSRSMMAEDAGMSRLDRAKDDIKQLLEHMVGGMIGVVAFAGRAELVCPLTDDFQFCRLVLDDVGVHSATLGGTNLGEAISAAVKAFGNRARRQRVIILMSDGEDMGKEALEQARKARELGISVYCIGIGDDQRGGLIPVEKDGQRSYLMYDGQQVWSRMNPETLKAIALAGGREDQPSRQVNSRQRTLEWLYSERLAPSEERTVMQKRRQVYYARAHWFAALALTLLLAETLLSERRSASPADSGEWTMMHASP